MITEIHPLQPFLPKNAKLLMLGSFPPPQKRWSMDFFYPNLINDMWRIFGIVFFADKNHFINQSKKGFYKEKIIDFLTEKGIALYDSAHEIKRLSDNASDKFLEVVQPTDIKSLLQAIPLCTAVCTTGEKATDIFLQQILAQKPKVGEHIEFQHNNRLMYFFRMPSSSRAYPLKLETKAEIYQKMFKTIGLFN
ncbi:MAG: uracil-DNA glycosylase family protein [Paludibacter sp.]|nr:uracil-DNA glycosylase family protein [Paludibacter sp.]